jgi:hypothetical protein
MGDPAEGFVDMKILWSPLDAYRSTYGLGLTWTNQLGVYELTCGDLRVGCLWGAGSLEATCHVATGCWTFKKRGLSVIGLASPRFRIEACGSDREVARFRKDLLRFSDGRHFTVAGGSWYDATNQGICQQGLETGSFGGITGGSLHIEPSAQHLPELALIIMLGWHLLVDDDHNDTWV